jgi:hypothetical protein
VLRHLKAHDRDYWFYLLGFIGGEAEAHYGLRGLLLFAAIVWLAFVLLVVAGSGGLIPFWVSKLRRLIRRR